MKSLSYSEECVPYVENFCFDYKKCEGNVGQAVELGERSCDAVWAVMEFTYLGDRVNAGGGSDFAVTARARCGRVLLRECGTLLCEKTFLLESDVFWSKAIDQLIVANNAHWYDRVLSRADGHVWSMSDGHVWSTVGWSCVEHGRMAMC